MSGEYGFSPAQCRAARALLDWSAERLARAAALDREAVELYEASAAELSDRELSAIRTALRRAGVLAIPARLAGEGVRLNAPKVVDHG